MFNLLLAILRDIEDVLKEGMVSYVLLKRIGSVVNDFLQLWSYFLRFSKGECTFLQVVHL